jgi:hypothetical protein
MLATISDMEGVEKFPTDIDQRGLLKSVFQEQSTGFFVIKTHNLVWHFRPILKHR